MSRYLIWHEDFIVKKDGQPYTVVTIIENKSVNIKELPVGNYCIEEDLSWSWRYNAKDITLNLYNNIELNRNNDFSEIKVKNIKTNNKWLNKYSSVIKNIFTLQQ